MTSSSAPKFDPAQVLDLGDRVVIVTGASGNIGSAITQLLVGCGATVVAQTRQLTDKDPNSFFDGVGPLERSGKVVWVASSLRSDSKTERVIEAALSQAGRLWGVVNNAADQSVRTWGQTTTAHFGAKLATNLFTIEQLNRKVVEAIGSQNTEPQKSGGSIVNIASVEGVTPNSEHADYSLSKSALITYSRMAANRYGRDNIRVNCVSPSLVHREGLDMEWPEGVARFEDNTPIGRLVRPEEVAAACLFLLSDLSEAITGINLVVDGGLLTSTPW